MFLLLFAFFVRLFFNCIGFLCAPCFLVSSFPFHRMFLFILFSFSFYYCSKVTTTKLMWLPPVQCTWTYPYETFSKNLKYNNYETQKIRDTIKMQSNVWLGLRNIFHTIINPKKSIPKISRTDSIWVAILLQ